MNQELRRDADAIIHAAIKAVLPYAAVRRALENKEFPGRVLLVAAGKAAWQMAHTAAVCLGGRIERGEGSIFIDCGAGEGGTLGCLCLETGEEFYA